MLSNFQTDVLRLLDQLKIQMAHQGETLQILLSELTLGKEEQKEEQFEFEMSKYPIKTKEKIAELEELLTANADARNCLVN